MSADFWSSIAAAHRVDDEDGASHGVLTPDPLESEPESDEDDRADGVFAPQFVQTTGVHQYMRTCRALGVIPVQQFISMLERDVVSLKHRGVGAVGGQAIFECLRHNQHIQSLDMEDNQLGLNVDVDAQAKPGSRGGLDPLCDAIRENSVLTNLDLSYNNLAARGCAAIAEAFEHNSSINELSLRGNNVGDFGAAALAAAVGKGKLAKLDVSDNGISELGGEALGKLIANAAGPLKQADFSWNALRLTGCLHVAEGLKTSGLVRLNLAWNGMGERGAEAVGGALKENHALQFLDISSNRIGEEGANHIAVGLRENQTLRSLQLNGNPIGDKGAIVLIDAVGHNCSVRDLGLQDCLTKKGGVGIFDTLNPTGGYSLNLSEEYEKAVLNKLIELDKMDEASNIPNFLNVCLNSKAVEFGEGGDMKTWPIPETGVLTFDYVCGKKVPKEARPLRDEVFQSFMRELSNPALSESTKLLMLRTAATTHFYTAEQVRNLVRLIEYKHRVDAVIMLFRRMVDPTNFAARVYDLLKPSEATMLLTRLGPALTPMLPEADQTATVFLTEEAADGVEAQLPHQA